MTHACWLLTTLQLVNVATSYSTWNMTFYEQHRSLQLSHWHAVLWYYYEKLSVSICYNESQLEIIGRHLTSELIVNLSQISAMSATSVDSATDWQLIRQVSPQTVTIAFIITDTVQARQPHCTNARRSRCQEDVNSFPFGKRGDHQDALIHVDETIQQELKSKNISLNEVIVVAQNRPLWRLMSTFGTTHSWWCIPQKKKDGWMDG